MIKIDFSEEIAFGFTPPNLCFLGNQEGFKQLSKTLIELTNKIGNEIVITSLPYTFMDAKSKKVVFRNIRSGNKLAQFEGDGNIIFELDEKYWDRFFRYFTLMLWEKSTYYLNCDEEALLDLKLSQGCNFICSSEF